jgi:hypothetical protein
MSLVHFGEETDPFIYKIEIWINYPISTSEGLHLDFVKKMVILILSCHLING